MTRETCRLFAAKMFTDSLEQHTGVLGMHDGTIRNTYAQYYGVLQKQHLHYARTKVQVYMYRTSIKAWPSGGACKRRRCRERRHAVALRS